MAEEDKTNILALFQAATGIEDLENAFSSLESVDWDLERALEIFAPKEQEPVAPKTPPRAPTPPSLQEAEQFDTFYPIQVAVRFQDQSHTFKVYSSKVITDFKTEVCVKFNIPSTHLHLTGWPCVVNDDMTLGDVSGIRHHTLKLTADKKSDETRVVYLQVSYPPVNVKEFVFPVKNTILELKQHVAEMSGIPTKDQIWSGLPVGATDNTVIRNSNFKMPLHALAVNVKKSIVSDPVVSSNSNSVAVNLDHQVSQDSIDGSSEYLDSEPDIDLIEDMDETPQDNFRDPMIPEHCIDQSEALALFSENFEKRYGQIRPMFYCGSMKEVISQSTKGELLDRRPVAVYLHHDSSISSNIFCQKILCSEIISEFLTSNYLIWAWDMTMPTNTTRFLDNVALHFGEEIRHHLAGLGPSNYPLLLIFQKKPASPLEIATMLTIDTPHDEALSLLVAGYEQHLAGIEELRDVEEARIKREQIKQEQDEAYNEAAERDKQAQLKRIQSQEAKLRSLAMHEDSIQKALRELPEEPEKGQGVTSIRFRLPCGDVINRRFLATDKIGLLYTYAQSRGFLPQHHRLIMNFPKKELSDFPSYAVLVECGLTPQAMVFIEEHFDDS